MAGSPPPPPPPIRTSSIRSTSRRSRKILPLSKSLMLLPLTAAARDLSVQRESSRSSAGLNQHHQLNVHSSSPRSSYHRTSAPVTFLHSLRHDHSSSLSNECITCPTTPSDCSTSSSGIATCPSLSSLNTSSPDQTKGLIARSSRVEHPERQHVSPVLPLADSSSVSRVPICPESDVHCVTRAVERLSVVSSGGTSCSSGVGASSESGGESSGRTVGQTGRDNECESPPPPLPPKLLNGKERSHKSSVRYACIDVSADATASKLIRCRTRAALPETTDHRLQSKSQTNRHKNNGHSMGVPPSTKFSDRMSEKKNSSSSRMIYLDAMERVKTSDTEIRAIQKRALMQFYLNCFNENDKKSPASDSSPPPLRPHTVSRQSSSSSFLSVAPHLTHPVPDSCPTQPLQTALPARVLLPDSADQSVAATTGTSDARVRCHGPDQERVVDDALVRVRSLRLMDQDSSQLNRLQDQKRRLMQDLKLNQTLASELMSKLKSNGLSAHESEKIRNHCSEIDTVTRLVLSLRSRLRSIEENGCQQSPPHSHHSVPGVSQQNNCWRDIANNCHHKIGTEKSMDLHLDLSPGPGVQASLPSSLSSECCDFLAQKRDRLLTQMDEALSLKGMIAERSVSIRDNILSKYLTGEGKESEANDSNDYIGLMYEKSQLITEISDVSQRICALVQNPSAPSVSADLTSPPATPLNVRALRPCLTHSADRT